MFFIKNLIHKFLNKQISNIYSKRFYNHKNTPKGVFWNNTLSQDLRLNLILDKVIKKSTLNTFSIADIGCGYGRLLSILMERKLKKRIHYMALILIKILFYFVINKKNLKMPTLKFKHHHHEKLIL